MSIQPIIIHHDRVKLVGYLMLLSLLAILVTVALAAASGLGIALVAAPFTLLLPGWVTCLLIRRPAALVIDMAGITHSVTVLGLGLIRWDEIEWIRMQTRGLPASHFLAIELADPEAVLSRHRQPARSILRAMIYLTDGHRTILVPQSMLPLSVEQLLGIIRAVEPEGQHRNRFEYE
jgi:hypothetical protein